MMTFSVFLQLWVYRCIQEFMFLQPRISKHPFYKEAKTALLNDKNKHILVCFPKSRAFFGLQIPIRWTEAHNLVSRRIEF